MDFDLVQLEGKTVTGIKIRTRNDDPEMPVQIDNLWMTFFKDGTPGRIAGITNHNPLGLYTNYENGVKGFYDLFVCFETDGKSLQPDDLFTREIPAGNYAKFIVSSNISTDIAAFWGNLWGMNLDRKFDSDFEEYITAQSGVSEEVHVYILLNTPKEETIL